MSNSSFIHELRCKFPISGRYSSLSHSQCVTVREELISLRPEDIPFYLGAVLADLIEYGDVAEHTQGIETLVNFLDPTSGIDREFIRARYGDAAAERSGISDSVTNAAKVKALAVINGEQAKLIHEWLQRVRAWKCLEWYREEIESTLKYWQERIGEGRQ